MKYFISVFSFLLLFTSCTKIENKDRVLTGQIVDSVSTPISNKPYLLIITSYKNTIGVSSPFTDDKVYEFNTDTNGNFSVTFRAGKKDAVNISLTKGTNDNTFYWGRDVAKDLEIDAGKITMPRR